jgi:hypothetical protein
MLHTVYRGRDIYTQYFCTRAEAAGGGYRVLTKAMLYSFRISDKQILFYFK